MSKIIGDLKDFYIEGDLNTIIKYHPASVVFLNENTTQHFSKTVWLYIKGTQKDEKFTPIPDYDYITITEKFLPEPNKRFTLLALVSNLMDLEWQRFKHYEMIPVLKELKILLEIKENKLYDSVSTKVVLTKQNPAGKRFKRLDVKNMKVDTVEAKENEQIIDIMINNRVDILFDPKNVFYDFQYLDRDLHPNSIVTLEVVNKFLQDLHIDKLSYKESEFNMLIAETVIDFLKAEMVWEDNTSDLTKGQGVIIYTILLLFDCLKEHLIEQHTTDEAKVNYVGGHLLRSSKRKKPKFIQLNRSKDQQSRKLNHTKNL